MFLLRVCSASAKSAKALSAASNAYFANFSAAVFQNEINKY